MNDSDSLVIKYKQTPLQKFCQSDNHKFIIIPKGRRAGATHGLAQLCTLKCIQEKSQILWGDTINSNIDRYVERYFKPLLDLFKNEIDWDYNGQKKQLEINNSWIDFRSADRPENWEGFGYNLIILNEAGIILKNNYLYDKAVLPMLLDFPDSQLIAAGTPKGKMTKDGKEHKFYTLAKKGWDDNEKDYITKVFSSYDNPLLSRPIIKQMEDDYDKDSARQEIYGEFLDSAGTSPFMHKFDETKHVSEKAVYNENDIVRLIFDFNADPWCVIMDHAWSDENGEHIHTFNSLSLSNVTVEEMCSAIRMETPHAFRTGAYLIAGDYNGNSRRTGENVSLYKQIMKELDLSENNLQFVPNPRQKASRTLSNTILNHHPDYIFHPLRCKDVIRDMKYVQCNVYGEILKSNRKDVVQQADFLDCVRYRDNTWHDYYVDEY